MAYKDKSQAIKHNNDYNREKYDRFSLMLPKGKKEVVQQKAKEAGMSVNEFINRAIDLLLEK